MIRINNVSKKYKNRFVLKDISLNIEGIYGLIGPNGAGKTTLMRSIAGLVDIDAGQIFIEENPEEENTNMKKIRGSIAYLPQDFNMYPRVSVEDCLNHLAILKGLANKSIRKERIHEVMERVNLLEHRKKQIRALSGGMRKRVGIAQMFLSDPYIIIIDEPTNGLDISERFRFRNLIRNISQDKTVIIASHIVEDIEFLCDKIGILKNGEVLKEGLVSEIADYAKNMVWEIVASPEQVTDIIKQYTVINIEKVTGGTLLIRVFSKSQPLNSQAVHPRLIDGYLSIINKGGDDFGTS